MSASDTPETTPADEAAPEQVVETTVATETAEAPLTAEELAAAAAAIDGSAADEAPPEAEVEVLAAPLNVDARNPIWAVGRRKSSTARIRMFPGGGNFIVNGKQLDDYFRLAKDQQEATSPLHLIDVRKKYDVWINVHGGGTTGQAGAIALGVTRALAILEPASEQALRDANLMSRDARVKERKKYGRRGARRGFQFSKR